MTDLQTATPLTAPLGTLHLEHACWANPRTIIDDDKLAELGVSIKENGILTPLHVARVMVNGDLIHLVLDGQRRVLAGSRVLAKNHPVPIIYAWPTVIEQLTWEVSDQLLALALDIGNRREGLSSYELVETAERLKGRGKTGAQIARSLNRSESWVSKMLKARLSATPKLLASWRRGDVSDEQFKDLAVEKRPEVQEEATKAVAAARKSGDKGEARMKAKETGATAKQRTAGPKEAPEPAKPAPTTKATTNGVRVVTPAVSGPQAELPVVVPPKKPQMVSRVVLEDMVGLTAKVPPVHDYVRGIFDAVQYVLGEMDPAKFGKPWHQYIARLEGKPRPEKAKAKALRSARAARAAKKAKK